MSSSQNNTIFLPQTLSTQCIQIATFNISTFIILQFWMWIIHAQQRKAAAIEQHKAEAEAIKQREAEAAAAAAAAAIEQREVKIEPVSAYEAPLVHEQSTQRAASKRTKNIAFKRSSNKHEDSKRKAPPCRFCKRINQLDATICQSCGAPLSTA